MDNHYKLPEVCITDKKYLYGTYIEMAFHNMFQTMNHIYSKVLGRDDITYALEEAKKGSDQDFAQYNLWKKMIDSLHYAEKEEEKLRAVELLYKHFPFLEPFIDNFVKQRYKKENKKTEHDAYEDFDVHNEQDNVYYVLEAVSTIIRELRNEFSHYLFYPSDTQLRHFAKYEQQILHCLKNTFDGARRVTKSRFGLTDQQVECAMRFTKPKSFKDKPKENQTYRYRMADVEIVNGKYIMHFTEFGIFFLICLFLEKRYVKIFSDKLKLVSKQDQGVILEMASIYSIRMHAKRITSERNIDAFALDMINEIRKCPEELYELLNEKDKAKFKVPAGLAEDGITDEAFMVRKAGRDRFHYFVMKYIDENKLFENLRFQVSLGKYFYEFYPKQCIDSTSQDRVRSLCKDLSGYGRLSEIENERTSVWKGIIRNVDDVHRNDITDQPYITDHKANYVLNGNRIGLKFIESNQQKALYMPVLADDGAINLAPDCWLSKYELAPLAFLLHLTSGKVVEQIIIDYITAYRSLFSDIASGKLVPQQNEITLRSVLNSRYGGLNLEDIPKKLQCYLLNKDESIEIRFKEWASTFVDRIYRSTQKRIESFNNKEQQIRDPKNNKIGKKNHVALRAGEIASYLAKDMLCFQPSTDNGRNKLTGLNYRVLQANLATYNDGNFARIKTILANARLINNADRALDNPILATVCKGSPKDIYQLYNAYLAAKKEYLKKCIIKGNYRKLPFLHADRIKWQERNEDYYKALAARYIKDESKGRFIDRAIELPRGLFNKAIIKELTQGASASDGELKNVALNPDNNISYIIRYYHTLISEDSLQGYYGYKRHYKLFDDLANVVGRKAYKSPEDIASMLRRSKDAQEEKNREVDALIKKELCSQKYNSRTGRFVQVHEESNQEEDATKMYNHLKQMKKTESALKQYQLQDIILFMLAKDILLSDNNGRSSALESDVINKLKLRTIDGLAISEKPVDVEVKVKAKNGTEKTISQKGIKFKDYPKFYNCLYDRRLPSLLELTKSSLIDKGLLDAELDKFDAVHPMVMQRVFNFEKDYYATHGKDFKYFYEMLELLAVKNKRLANSIRNCFAHLSYIEDLSFKEKMDFSRDLVNAYDQVMSDLKSKELSQKAEVMEDMFEKIVTKNG